MKNKNIMADIFARRSNNNAQVGMALVVGLAVGAVLGVLFAPESGEEVRKGISGKAKELGDSAKDIYASLSSKITGEVEADEPATEQEDNDLAQSAVKKPKSDIKELIHEAHVGGHHPEEHMN